MPPPSRLVSKRCRCSAEKTQAQKPQAQKPQAPPLQACDQAMLLFDGEAAGAEAAGGEAAGGDPMSAGFSGGMQ